MVSYALKFSLFVSLSQFFIELGHDRQFLDIMPQSFTLPGLCPGVL